MCLGGCSGRDSRWTQIELPLLCYVLYSFIPRSVLWCARLEVLKPQSPFKLFSASLCNLQAHTLIFFSKELMFFPHLVTSFLFCTLVLINFYTDYMCLWSGLCSVRRRPLVVYTARGLFDSCRVLLHLLLHDVIKVLLFTLEIWTVCAEAVHRLLLTCTRKWGSVWCGCLEMCSCSGWESFVGCVSGCPRQHLYWSLSLEPGHCPL